MMATLVHGRQHAGHTHDTPVLSGSHTRHSIAKRIVLKQQQQKNVVSSTCTMPLVKRTPPLMRMFFKLGMDSMEPMLV